MSPNITPDLGTGIGAWTDDEFLNSLTRGTGRNGMHLYPAMPYTYMTKVTRDDALAIRAYLNTLQPVYNPVTVNQLAFPFDVREGMRAWNELYFKPGTFQPRADKSPEWNRGAYLAEGLCIAACAIRRRMRPAAMKRRDICKGTRCKVGTRPTSPMMSGAVLAGGRSTISSRT